MALLRKPTNQRAIMKPLISQSSTDGSTSLSNLKKNLDMFYFNGIRRSIQRWFSTYGFSGGPLPIEIPETVRKLSDKRSGLQKGSSRLIPGVRRELPTIYDMMSHLIGRPISSMPGILIIYSRGCV